VSAKALFLGLLFSSTLYAQEVFLRLSDYAGGKNNIVIEPFKLSGSQDFISKASAIGMIIRDDLDYSLYFDIYPDTSYLLGEPKKSGVVLKAKGVEPQLTITLVDFESHETIHEMTFPLAGEIRALAHKISDSIIEMLTGEKGVASTRIVFSYAKGNGKEIGVTDYDGYNFAPITNNHTYNLFPAWAPDGAGILYSSYAKDRLNMYIYDLASRKNSLLASNAGLNYAPCWSPDGAKIALTLTKDGNAEIYLLDLGTKKLSRLTNNRAIDCSPAFSPNSRELAFVSDRSGNPQVYIMDAYGGNVRRLTFHGSYNTSPAWSPRGDLIAYVSREDDNTQQIYVTDPNDFLPVRLTYERNNEEPAWSPDGLHIVFSSNRGGVYELFSMNWDGTRQRRLTHETVACSPDWSSITE
jgi:TolB protein